MKNGTDEAVFVSLPLFDPMIEPLLTCSSVALDLFSFSGGAW